MSANHPKRLAITISGAVSLGSYEAGVLYEVLTALREHNENPATTPDERIEVDVLTGASAGGMTAAIAAQVLLGGSERLTNADDNAFFNPWVREVDLAGLLKCDPVKDPPSRSILASSLVETLGDRHILAAPGGTRHPAAPADGRPLKLGLAMSQVNGVDYTEQVQDASGPSQFTYTRFQDEFTWDIPAAAAGFGWQEVRAAALACGAFPFAFRCRGIARAWAKYPGAGPFTPDPRDMVFLDGGVFHNEPLGLAKDLVEQVDDHRNNDSRFYLFVAPGRKTGVSDGTEPIREADMTLLNTAKCLVKSVFWQARFQDWINAARVNRRIARLDLTAHQLAEAMLATPGLAAEIAPGVSALLPLYYAGRLPDLEEDLGRLRTEYATMSTTAGVKNYGTLLGDAATVWLKAVLLLEHAAGLTEKETMKIYTITADDESLAGEKFFAFAGFIDEKARRHDYSVGRLNARRWLQGGTGGLFPIRASCKEPIPPPDPKMGGMELKDFDRKKRKDLADQVRDRADEMMKEIGVNRLLRGLVDTFVLGPKLRKLMGL
jgi:hypothetical protein